MCTQSRGITGKIFWGGKVIFPYFFPGVKCFFPVENFDFGRPKTNFHRFEKWKAKKKKKKGPLLILELFPLPSYNFPSFLHHFPVFLASFFPVGDQKFPIQKSQGGTLPPACYTTDSEQSDSSFLHQNLLTWGMKSKHANGALWYMRILVLRPRNKETLFYGRTLQVGSIGGDVFFFFSSFWWQKWVA